MFEEILPKSVAIATTRDEINAALFPEEREAIRSAVGWRRREFVTARASARIALDQLGLSPQAIPRGEGGAPQWPAGIVGSITHCDGYRACAAGRLVDFTAIGIDAEPNLPLPDRVLGKVTLPEERTWLRRLAAEAPAVCWDRLTFSIKESTYKAWFPLTRKWLDFKDASVTIDAQHQTFSVRLNAPEPTVDRHWPTGFRGRWLVRDGLVLTAIAPPTRACPTSTSI